MSTSELPKKRVLAEEVYVSDGRVYRGDDCILDMTPKKRILVPELCIIEGRLYKGGTFIMDVTPKEEQPWTSKDPALFILLPEEDDSCLVVMDGFFRPTAEFLQEYKTILDAVEARPYGRPMYSFDAKAGLGKIIAGWIKHGLSRGMDLKEFLRSHPGHSNYTIALLHSKD